MNQNKKSLYLFNLLVVVPILWALGTNRIQEDHKAYVVVLSLVLGFYYLYKLFISKKEGMNITTTIYGNTVHHMKIFDVSPGFDKPRLIINSGDVVVWTNIGLVEHTVTGENDEFNSGYLRPGEMFSVKFNNKGEFYYYCMMHKGWMRGLIIVV